MRSAGACSANERAGELQVASGRRPFRFPSLQHARSSEAAPEGVHAHLNITEQEWNAMAAEFEKSLVKSTLREFCVNQLRTVVNSHARYATGVPVSG